MMLRKGDVVLTPGQQPTNGWFILWVCPQQDRFVYIDLSRPSSRPDFDSLTNVLAHLDAGTRLLVNIHNLFPLTTRDISLSEENRRDARMAVIRPLIQSEPAIYIPERAGTLIANRSKELGKSRNTTKSLLLQYWHGGLRPNALLDDCRKCGAPDVKRRALPGSPKRGRKVDPLFGEAHDNITQEHIKQFEMSTARHRRSMTSKYTPMGAYRLFRQDYCYDYSEVGGELTPELKPRYRLIEPPSYAQFWAWYNDTNQADKAARKRLGEAIVVKDHRALVSTSTFASPGPGFAFQIDATWGNHGLSLTRDRRVNVGRPILYFVSDVWSRYIVGYYIGFIDPSWEAAMMALSCAFLPKRPILERLGFDLAKNPWDAEHVCTTLGHDGGELTDRRASFLIKELRMTFEQATAERGDLKGVVERKFGWSDAQYAEVFKGRRAPMNYEGRARDDELAAAGQLLNIKEFEREVVRTILHFNNEHLLEKYDADSDLIDAGVPRIPAMIWQFGCEHRGRPRRYEGDEIKQIMMPRQQVSVEPEGIRFGPAHFTCRELWPLQKDAAVRKVKAWISFDWLSDHILWHSSGLGLGLTPCALADRSRMFTGLNHQEILEKNAGLKGQERNARARSAAAAAARGKEREIAQQRAASARPSGPKLSKTEQRRGKAAARGEERDSERARFSGERQIHSSAPTTPANNVVAFRRGLQKPSVEDIENASD